jgi:hypothetical protein
LTTNPTPIKGGPPPADPRPISPASLAL